MTIEEIKYLCKALAKATRAAVRIYHGGERLYYYSVFGLEPDPATAYLPEMTASTAPAGVITTPLYQFYSYAFVRELCIITGPTCILAEDVQLLDSMMFLLGLSGSQRSEYIQKLLCAPSISLEGMTWLTSYLYGTLNGAILPVEKVQVAVQTQSHRRSVAQATAEETLRTAQDEGNQADVRNAYAYEKMLAGLIESGRPDLLQELFDSAAQIKAGKMAKETLRQTKNMGICATTVTTRAAIAGGLDSQSAFRLSDLYIQRIEMLCDSGEILRLINELMLDFAQRVQGAKHADYGDMRVFEPCAKYVSENLFREIRIEDMAKAVGFARPYLCSRFKKETGRTLTQYILDERLQEAKRLLQFTHKPLCEIAAALAFSSQSHFQTVFKKLCGETPAHYRRRVK